MHRTVRQLLEQKGHAVWSIEPERSVYQAIEAMAEHRCGALVVLHEGKLAGIVSERDYARKVILKNKASKGTAVQEVMTSEVYCVGPGHSMESCMQLMSERKVRHLPVMVEDRVVGVLSMGDVIRTLLHERESTIRDLEHYICS